MVSEPWSGQSWNGYGYVGNSPPSYADPTGLFRAGPRCNVGGAMCLEQDGAGGGFTNETQTLTRVHVSTGVLLHPVYSAHWGPFGGYPRGDGGPGGFLGRYPVLSPARYVAVPWLHLGRRTTRLTTDGGPQVADGPIPGGSDAGLPPLPAGPVDEPGLDEGWEGILTDPTILIGGGVGAVAKGVASKAPAVARTAWASIRGLFVRGVVRGYPYTVDDLFRSMITTGANGVSPIARAIEKHSVRPGSAFPRLTGNQQAKNAAASHVALAILANPRTLFSRQVVDRGRFRNYVDAIAPDGRGLRFAADGRFIGVLEPRRR